MLRPGLTYPIAPRLSPSHARNRKHVDGVGRVELRGECGRGGLDASRGQPHHPRAATPAPAAAPRRPGLLRVGRDGQRVHGDAGGVPRVHVPRPGRAVQAHPLRAAARPGAVARRGLRVAALAAPVPGRAPRGRADARRRARRPARQGAVPPAVAVGGGGCQGNRRPAAERGRDVVRVATRRRGLPGVPGGDGGGSGGCARRRGGAAGAADVRHVPELGARRVLRAVEAKPGAAGGDVRRVPGAVAEAEQGPGAGPAAVHQPVGVHERGERRGGYADRRWGPMRWVELEVDILTRLRGLVHMDVK